MAPVQLRFRLALANDACIISSLVLIVKTRQNLLACVTSTA